MTWNTSFQPLLACKVSFEKSADILVGSPLFTSHSGQWKCPQISPIYPKSILPTPKGILYPITLFYFHKAYDHPEVSICSHFWFYSSLECKVKGRAFMCFTHLYIPSIWHIEMFIKHLLVLNEWKIEWMNEKTRKLAYNDHQWYELWQR